MRVYSIFAETVADITHKYVYMFLRPIPSSSIFRTAKLSWLLGYYTQPQEAVQMYLSLVLTDSSLESLKANPSCSRPFGHIQIFRQFNS